MGRQDGVGTVLICGYAAEGCTLKIYRGSKTQSYETIVLRDGVASGKKVAIRIVQAITKAKRIDEIRA